MNMNRQMKIAGGVLALSLILSHSASAEIWCNDGTIVNIGNVIWDESAIYVNYPGIIPDDIPPGVVGNIDQHITQMAMTTYADGFAGGGGGFGGFSVPNSGEVKAIAYDPYSFTNTLDWYQTTEGVKFTMLKCYTIPPMSRLEILEPIQPIAKPLPALPAEKMRIRPLEGTEGLDQYWYEVQSHNR